MEVVTTTKKKRDIWKQEQVQGGLIRCGFFMFETKVDKSTNEPLCNLKSTLSVDNILFFALEHGYRNRKIKGSNKMEPIRVEGNIMDPVTIEMVIKHAYDELKSRPAINIKFSGSVFTFNKIALTELYLKMQNQVFNKRFFDIIKEFNLPHLKDSVDKSYIFFKNTIIEVDSSGYRSLPYSQLKKLEKTIWKNEILEREFNEKRSSKRSEYESFVENVCNKDQKRISAFKSGLGYLMHRFNASHIGKAVMLYDETPSDTNNPNGRTGKGVTAQALANMRPLAILDGKGLNDNSPFNFQTVKESDNIIFIDDVKSDQGFQFFFSKITDGLKIERKGQPAIQLSVEESPKIMFASNSILGGTGTSDKGRQFILEFSDYYSSKLVNGQGTPVKDEHGVLFDKENWTDQQWGDFTNYMLDCLHLYLKDGLQPYEQKNTWMNRLIQKYQRYPLKRQFPEFISNSDIIPGMLYETGNWFDAYKEYIEYEEPLDGGKKFHLRSFTEMIKNFADAKGWQYLNKTQEHPNKIPHFLLVDPEKEGFQN